jgi:hypothetical protein
MTGNRAGYTWKFIAIHYIDTPKNNKIPPLAGLVVRSWYWLRRHYQRHRGSHPLNYFIAYRPFSRAGCIPLITKNRDIYLAFISLEPVNHTSFPITVFRILITRFGQGTELIFCLDSEICQVAAKKSKTNNKKISPQF